jgi:ribonuclease G
MKKLLIEKNDISTRVALAESGELVEYYVERINTRKIVGNIYKGKVQRIHPSMEVAFVNICADRNAFLYIGENVEEDSPLEGLTSKKKKVVLNEGDEILCQVIKDEFGQKGARLTLDITLPGRLLVMMPKTDFIGISNKIKDDNRQRLLDIMNRNRIGSYGYIVRTAAVNSSEEELLAEAIELKDKWEVIRKKYDNANACCPVHYEDDLICRAVRDILRADCDEIIINNRVILDEIKSLNNYRVKTLFCDEVDLMSRYGLTPQIESLTKKKVVMKNGSSIVIDKVEALTVIDVNTGKYLGLKYDNLENTVFTTNLLAAEEIARQLRLRNIGGIIIVDFIDMEEPAHREELMKRFADCLSRDRVKTTLVGMTNLGLVELTRKKIRSPIGAFMLQKCPYCNGDGYIHSDEYTLGRIKRALIMLFSDSNIKDAVVKVNKQVFNKIIELGYFKSFKSEIKDINICFIPDDRLHNEKFIISAEKVNALPQGAIMI